MDRVEVVVAHDERATLRVGDVFVKVDSDQARLDREVEVMALVPVPTPEVRWRQPPALALAKAPGEPLGRLGAPSSAPPAAWVAAGAAVRALHDAPLPPWPGRQSDDLASHLDRECEWLVANGVLTAATASRNRELADLALGDAPSVFIHGDLQVDHVFVAGDEVTAIIDWSEGAPGDACFDLATLALGHPDRLDDLLVGYGADVDRDRVRGWWSARCLGNVRWLAEHGFGPPESMFEVAVLRTQA